MKRTILFLLSAWIVLWSSCTACKRDDCSSGALQFNVPVQAYGIKDTLQVGDTLRIKLQIPEQLAERNSGIIYDFIDYNFKLITYIVRIDSLPVVSDSKSAFNWTTNEGESTYAGGSFLVMPIYSNNTYKYEVLAVPKQKGLYVFGMNSVFFRASPLEQLKGPCSKNTVEVYAKLVNDTNVNFEFLKNSPEPSQANTDRQRFDDFAGFCFYVE